MATGGFVPGEGWEDSGGRIGARLQVAWMGHKAGFAWRKVHMGKGDFSHPVEVFKHLTC